MQVCHMTTAHRQRPWTLSSPHLPALRVHTRASQRRCTVNGPQRTRSLRSLHLPSRIDVPACRTSVCSHHPKRSSTHQQRRRHLSQPRVRRLQLSLLRPRQRKSRQLRRKLRAVARRLQGPRRKRRSRQASSRQRCTTTTSALTTQTARTARRCWLQTRAPLLKHCHGMCMSTQLNSQTTAANVLSQHERPWPRSHIRKMLAGRARSSSIVTQPDGTACARRGASKPEKLLAEEAFSFVKNECGPDKWVAVELSLRVRVASVELLQVELYSSRVKEFELFGSPSKPAVASGATAPWTQPPWHRLGRFRALNRKGMQVRGCRLIVQAASRCSIPALRCAAARVDAACAVPYTCVRPRCVTTTEAECDLRRFPLVSCQYHGQTIQESVIFCAQAFDVASARWSRYVLLRLVSHHGTEAACTINTLRVFGTTEAEDLEAELHALEAPDVVDGLATTAAAAAAEAAAAAANPPPTERAAAAATATTTMAGAPSVETARVGVRGAPPARTAASSGATAQDNARPASGRGADTPSGPLHADDNRRAINGAEAAGAAQGGEGSTAMGTAEAAAQPEARANARERAGAPEAAQGKSEIEARKSAWLLMAQADPLAYHAFNEAAPLAVAPHARAMGGNADASATHATHAAQISAERAAQSDQGDGTVPDAVPRDMDPTGSADPTDPRSAEGGAEPAQTAPTRGAQGQKGAHTALHRDQIQAEAHAPSLQVAPGTDRDLGHAHSLRHSDDTHAGESPDLDRPAVPQSAERRHRKCALRQRVLPAFLFGQCEPHAGPGPASAGIEDQLVKPRAQPQRKPVADASVRESEEHTPQPTRPPIPEPSQRGSYSEWQEEDIVRTASSAHTGAVPTADASALAMVSSPQDCYWHPRAAGCELQGYTWWYSADGRFMTLPDGAFLPFAPAAAEDALPAGGADTTASVAAATAHPAGGYAADGQYLPPVPPPMPIRTVLPGAHDSKPGAEFALGA